MDQQAQQIRANPHMSPAEKEQALESIEEDKHILEDMCLELFKQSGKTDDPTLLLDTTQAQIVGAGGKTAPYLVVNSDLPPYFPTRLRHYLREYHAAQQAQAS